METSLFRISTRDSGFSGWRRNSNRFRRRRQDAKTPEWLTASSSYVYHSLLLAYSLCAVRFESGTESQQGVIVILQPPRKIRRHRVRIAACRLLAYRQCTRQRVESHRERLGQRPHRVRVSRRLHLRPSADDE